MNPDSDVIVQTQKQWLRKAGQERWEQSELSKDQREFVLHWAEAQGLFSPWTPACQSYDKALILGATTSRMQLRLDYLKKLWMQGVRFQEIVWLTGERPLDKRVDALTDRCSNESQAAHILWEEADLPKEMRSLPVIYVEVPMKPQGRPNTEDTIVAWLNTGVLPCSAIFISDQPFCGYQFAIIKTLLPEAFAFDVVGQGADPTSHPAAAAITLDALARWLYQDKLWSQRPSSCH
jgi:hypothetical protein